jgi:hypothetical protein
MARLKAGCIAVSLLAPALAFADGTAPAVSDVNAKVSVEGGQYDGEQSALSLGSLTVPLGHSFGLQADGAIGRIDEGTMGGGGLHLFARDPSRYLVGFYGSYHTWESIDIARAAVELQLYAGRFALDGLAGYESVAVPDTIGGLTVTDPHDDHLFGQLDLAYYALDDLRLYGGYRYVNETSRSLCRMSPRHRMCMRCRRTAVRDRWRDYTAPGRAKPLSSCCLLGASSSEV